jgi:hypothetical protein
MRRCRRLSAVTSRHRPTCHAAARFGWRGPGEGAARGSAKGNPTHCPLRRLKRTCLREQLAPQLLRFESVRERVSAATSLSKPIPLFDSNGRAERSRIRVRRRHLQALLKRKSKSASLCAARALSVKQSAEMRKDHDPCKHNPGGAPISRREARAMRWNCSSAHS